MSDFEAALLGVVQGLTEFLPVSSSGHLVIGEALLGRAPDGLTFEIALHFGTLFAILLHYRARVRALALGALRREDEALAYLGKLALGSLPAALAGLGLRAPIEWFFAELPLSVGVALIVTGALLLTTRRTLPRARRAAPSWRDALLIGLAQACALAPGLSRSGVTVAVALLLGVRALAAAEFSFLLGALAIFGASLLALPEIARAPADEQSAYLIGGGAALLAGLAALVLFVRLLRTQHFHHFAWYCFAAGAGFFAFALFAR